MTEQGSVGIVETKYFTFGEPPDAMELDCGQTLGPITLAYETYGRLNADKSNAVLIVHALSGDAHAAGMHTPMDRKPGWWDSTIGPGKAFDTNRYFVICSNVLGGCRGSTGPSSIDPATGKPFGLKFPIITVGDMVRAQRQLIDHVGITQLLAVAGGSMGGMQTLEWATRYPEAVRSAIVIAATHRSGAQEIAFNAVGRHAIQADPAFRDGDYYQSGQVPGEGLSIARMLAHITYLSQQSMHEKFGRALRASDAYSYDFDSEFSVETYLDYQGEQFVNRFDANSYLYITKAIDYFDLSAQYGSLDDALARVQAKMLVISFTSDWLYTPAESEKIVHTLTRHGKDVSYVKIKSDYGHDAFLLEVDAMTRVMGGFLERVLEPEKCCARLTPCINSGQDRTAPQPLSDSIYDGRRIDYERILDLVEPGSRVLDVGCGDGMLLCRLTRQKQVKGTGLELAPENVIRGIACGLSVVQADIDKGLSGFPAQSYDYVLLSMTLQVIRKPEVAIREMLRVGRKCIVSFPNFAFWKVRAKALLLGKAPVTRNLPYAWHTSPNRHVLSIKDFRQFCESHDAEILREIPISSHGRRVRTAQVWPNLLADEAVFVITSRKKPAD